MHYKFTVIQNKIKSERLNDKRLFQFMFSTSDIKNVDYNALLILKIIVMQG
jgi:hypothetical protein